jgi:hypothetical protein
MLVNAVAVALVVILATLVTAAVIKGRRIWPRGTKDGACGRHGCRHYCLLLPRSTWVTAGRSGKRGPMAK